MSVFKLTTFVMLQAGRHHMDSHLKRIFFSLLKHQVAARIIYLPPLSLALLQIHINIILFIILAAFITVLSHAFSLCLAQFV